MGNKRKLESDPETIAAALMESSTRKEAAQKLGVSDRTLYEWSKSFQVQAVLSALRADQLRGRMQILEDAQMQAIETITAMLKDDKASNADKIRAAQLILSAGSAARSEYFNTDTQAIGRLRNAQKLDDERSRANPLEFDL